MARYRKLDLRVWSDEKFRELSALPPSGQSLWLYLILGPQTTNIPGLFESSEVAMADRLGWSLEAFREAFREVSREALPEGCLDPQKQPMAKADWKARLVWLPNALQYNRPESPNVVVSWGTVFDELPECDIKREAYQSLKAFAEGLGEAYSKAFDKAFRKPSPKAMPNQKQEQKQIQEQEQEQKQKELPVEHDRSTSVGSNPESENGREGKGSEAEATPLNGAVLRIFDHWKGAHRHPNARLDDKRRKVISKALDGYSEADLCQCISGYLNSPHHMGQNKRDTVYDDIELMLRDAKHIDAGLKFYAEPPRKDLSEQTRRVIDQTEDWEPPEVRRASN